MTSVGGLYLKEIHREFDYLATWLPNTHLKLGDVGLLQGDKFVQQTSLNDLEVPFKVRKGAKSTEFTWTSKSGFSLYDEGSGTTIPPGATIPLAKAGASIKFSKEGAFVFRASGCMIDGIDNIAGLRPWIVDLLKKKVWDKNWAIVNTLVRADSATIIVSKSRESTLDITAEVPITLATLTDIDAGLSVNGQQGDIIQFIAAKGLSPLFKRSRVKRSLISKLLDNDDKIILRELGGDRTAVDMHEDDIFESVSPQ